MMEKAKFYCKDCLHCIPSDSSIFAACSHPASITPKEDMYYLVSGKHAPVKTEMLPCSIMRKDYPDRCGPEARFFQPRPKAEKVSWWKRLL
ncbi:MAG: hypothetical protein EPO08_20870 [Rhodospirillaceae bacterium]|nr:MAG: hypothetical protein EPO08_20870 [Rhodospirillaceae bacterium]